MAQRFDADDRASIGALFTRLIDDGSRLAKAEVSLAKALAKDRASRSAVAVAMLVAALLLAQASVTTLLVGILIWVTVLIGPLAAALVVALLGLAICGLLVWLAIHRLSAVFAGPGAGK